MIIRQYGIELHRVKHEDIELIRTMRNREDIRRRMFDQEIVSPEQQENWFLSINNMHNYYFLIHHNSEKIGLIYGKNLDFDKRENEGGIFVWADEVIGSGIATKASICLMELSFEFFLANQVFARVRDDNPAAYHHNVSLGYAASPNGRGQMILTRAAYESRIGYLRKLASGGRGAALSISDIEIPEAHRQRKLYEGLPRDILDRIAPALKRSGKER